MQLEANAIATIVLTPIVVPLRTTVMEAILLMSGSATETAIDPGCVLIVEDGRLLGMLTERDVVGLMVDRSNDLANLAIEDVMTANVVTLRTSAAKDLAVAIELLERHQIRYLPVVDEGDGVVGILTYERLQHHLVKTVEQQQAQLHNRAVRCPDLSNPAEIVRQEAAADLGESQQFMQTVFNTLPLAVFWKDRASRYLGCNQNFARDANLDSPTDIIGKTDYDLPWGANEGADYCGDDRQVIDAGVAKLGIIETQTRADGSVVWLETNKLPLQNLNGETIGVVGTYQDITARKRTEQKIRQQAERESMLREMTQRIRKSLELPTIFETAVREIRQFMATDRVGIFKFHTDINSDEGEFVAESVGAGFESMLTAKIHSIDLAEKLLPSDLTQHINRLEDIDPAELFDEEVELLTKFQVQAHLTIPLMNGLELWGLLCIHHCAAPRSWAAEEVDFIQHLAEQIGIAIQQATFYEKIQLELRIRWETEAAVAHQLRQQRTLGAISRQIRNSLSVEEILATATRKVQDLLKVDRVTIFRLSENRQIRAVREVVAPEYPSLLDLSWEDRYIGNEEFEFYLQGNVNIVPDVTRDAWSEYLQEYIQQIRLKSKIVAPILLPSRDSKTYSQPDGNCQKIWGLISVHSCSDPRQWQDGEAQLLQQIADKLAIAIQQASLFEQLQSELTERQQAETQLIQRNEELARATRLKDEFLANMSHELRTPLNAVLGMTEGLQDRIFGPITDRQIKSLALIEKSGRHLLSLITDILDLSKIEANQFKLELSDIIVKDLCQNSILFIKELAFKKKVKLETILPPYLTGISIRVDDRRCRQVLINLLINAVKFTPEGGCVTLDLSIVDLRREKDATKRGERSFTIADNEILNEILIGPEVKVGSPWRIAFSIIDTGIGIAPENMDKLFQSFSQIDSSLSRQYAGTGLGLALVKRIVELHSGNVLVRSQLGKGSCFTVFLPFFPNPESRVRPSLGSRYLPPIPHSDTPSPEAKALVLVVEDNEASMETMSGYLRGRGYHPIEARSAEQAMGIIRKSVEQTTQTHRPDIILMDINLPDVSGWETIRSIRQTPSYADTPIVALTAFAMYGDRKKSLDAGANEHVSKPTRLSQLVSIVEKLLAESKDRINQN